MTPMRLALPMCAAAGLLWAGAAVSTAGPQAGAAALVTMQTTGFEPRVLTVKVGDRITWVNNDLFPHTATADDKAFDSGSIAPSGTWDLVAKKPGTYTYTCTFHPNMKGTINVQ
jgi:plastocyanin